MPVPKTSNVLKNGCAHTPFREKSFFGRFCQYLRHSYDDTTSVPRCVSCGTPLRSPVEHYFTLLSTICFILSAGITWLTWAYIAENVVRLSPVKLLLIILFTALAVALEFLLVRIVSACVCAGARWMELDLYTDNDDTLKLTVCERNQMLRNGLRHACGRGISIALWVSVQLPIGCFVLIDAAMTLAKRLFIRDYRYLWVWIAAIAYSALAMAVELLLENTFAAIPLNCVSVLVVAIINILVSHLDVN